MDKIAIIGANSFQNPLILKAKEMGLETHVFAWRENAVGEKTADYFYPISVVETEKILSKCREISPRAVLTIASDLAAITANTVARALGLPANSAACVRNTTNKFAMRTCFLRHGISVPKFACVDERDCAEKTADFSYPLIVKPTDRSGSRSITEVHSPLELPSAVARAAADSFENKAIAEEYICGEEYSMESITQNAKHTVLAITKKYTTGAPHYIETGHLQPSGLPEPIRQRAIAEVTAALDALGVMVGASHAEFRVDDQGRVRIIEIGARMGGDCIGSDLVRISTGYDFVRMTIEAAMGIPVSFDRIQTPKTALIRFLMTAQDVDRFAEIRRRYAQKICFVSEIAPMDGHAVIDSGSRYGYYICALDTQKEAEELLHA